MKAATTTDSHWREEAVYHFQRALIQIHTQSVRRLLSSGIPEEYLPACTGAPPLWCDLIVQDLKGELKNE